MVNVHYASSQFWQFSLRLDKWHLLGRHHDIMLCAMRSINCSTICKIPMHSNKCALFSEKVCKHPSWLWNVHSLALQWRYNVRCTVAAVWRLEVHTRPRWQRESLPPVLRSPRLASHCTQHLAMKTVRHPLYDRGHFMVFMKFKDSCDKPTADPLLMDLIAGVMNCCAQRTLQKHNMYGPAILWKGRLEYPLVAREAKCIPICLLAIYSLH